MTNVEFIKNINEVVESWYDNDSTWMELDERIGILSICNGNEDEVYTFQGDDYCQLESDYENQWTKDYVNFKDYVIYISQSW